MPTQIPKPKSQITKPNPETRDLELGIWDLELGIWDFAMWPSGSSGQVGKSRLPRAGTQADDIAFESVPSGKRRADNLNDSLAPMPAGPPDPKTALVRSRGQCLRTAFAHARMRVARHPSVRFSALPQLVQQYLRPH